MNGAAVAVARRPRPRLTFAAFKFSNQALSCPDVSKASYHSSASVVVRDSGKSTPQAVRHSHAAYNNAVVVHSTKRGCNARRTLAAAAVRMRYFLSQPLAQMQRAVGRNHFNVICGSEGTQKGKGFVPPSVQPRDGRSRATLSSAATRQARPTFPHPRCSRIIACPTRKDRCEHLPQASTTTPHV